MSPGALPGARLHGLMQKLSGSWPLDIELRQNCATDKSMGFAEARYVVTTIFRRHLSCQRKSVDLPFLTILTVFACF
jgi:hypothetical protein